MGLEGTKWCPGMNHEQAQLARPINSRRAASADGRSAQIPQVHVARLYELRSERRSLGLACEQPFVFGRARRLGRPG